ncbi:MAG: GGDEF domain-containing protein [Candidatus Metalachnospira sp.]|nr:GGDEF domain-containing protein [Candidatus Metalachnospira sp.]
MKILSDLKKLRPYIVDDNVRIRIQFLFIYGATAIVALVMTIVNLFTQQYTLMLITLVFAIFCVFSMLLSAKNKINIKLSVTIFVVAFFSLFSYFIISGNPEGFSVIWICILPSCGLLVFGRKRGTIICAAMLALILFFFRTQIGLSLIQYEYTDSFRLRFPLLYSAFYMISLLLESVRVITHDELNEVQDKYRYLYSHDALTGVFNRHGFNECLDNALNKIDESSIALIIIDVDQLKKINDEYGHIKGDQVLKSISDTLVKNVPLDSSVCRWGGDEFAILSCGNVNFKEFSEKLCFEISNTPINLGEETINVTASIGISAAYHKANCTAAKLVNCADDCLYRAKESGRNQVVYEKLDSI